MATYSIMSRAGLCTAKPATIYLLFVVKSKLYKHVWIFVGKQTKKDHEALV